ncbi:putative ATPase [Xanthomonas arboricola]|uniref:DUF3696 domain-containing protein n=1 Tax=Xanthomonas TaxID=338 RepID=UPI0016099C9D|nr:DUF3696 domain-containing protein [Xanthomonas arboricola]MBB3796974.1 putative ATPase [Xanthomonas arboricola]
MGIKQISLKNFKKFKSVTIPLDSAITVILGENSSGKSSILKALLGLKQTISSANEHECWAAHGDYVDLGVFQDYIHKKDTSKSFTVSITLSNQSLKHSMVTRRLMLGLESLTLDFTYDYDQITSQSRFLTILATYGNKNEGNYWELTRQKTRKTYVIKFSESLLAIFNDRLFPLTQQKLTSAEKIVVSHGEKFTFQRSSLSRKISHVFALRVINETIESATSYFEKNLFYLAPLRSSPSRSYIRSSHNLAVGVKGEHTPSVLANLEKRTQKVTRGESKFSRDLAFFSLGLEQVFPGHYASTKTFDELVKVKIGSRRTSDYVSQDKSDSITDVGFGFSQVFPIIVQSAVLPKDATLVIEQPELHLHPMAQTRLAGVIARASFEGRRFIIETHSEHFVRGLQIAVSENRSNQKKGISKDDVKFIYLRNSVSSPFESLILNEYGEFKSDWPEGFFDESYRSMRKLLANRTRS